MPFLKSEIFEKEEIESMEAPIDRLIAVDSEAVDRLIQHFNITRDEFTIDNLKKLFEEEARLLAAQSGRPFISQNKLMSGVMKLEQKWNLKIDN